LHLNLENKWEEQKMPNRAGIEPTAWEAPPINFDHIRAVRETIAAPERRETIFAGERAFFRAERMERAIHSEEIGTIAGRERQIRERQEQAILAREANPYITGEYREQQIEREWHEHVERVARINERVTKEWVVPESLWGDTLDDIKPFVPRRKIRDNLATGETIYEGDPGCDV
jgi:hypothetical protein